MSWEELQTLNQFDSILKNIDSDDYFKDMKIDSVVHMLQGADCQSLIRELHAYRKNESTPQSLRNKCRDNMINANFQARIQNIHTNLCRTERLPTGR